MDNATAIPTDTKHDLFVDKLRFDTKPTGSRRRPTSFSACAFEVNPPFITSDDSVQNFVLALILQQISAGPIASVVICINQFIWHTVIEILWYVYVMHCATNRHGSDI